jgi:hypothetical protein
LTVNLFKSWNFIYFHFPIKEMIILFVWLQVLFMPWSLVTDSGLVTLAQQCAGLRALDIFGCRGSVTDLGLRALATGRCSDQLEVRGGMPGPTVMGCNYGPWQLGVVLTSWR